MAQNTHRIQQLKEISKALEMYRSDHGTYPLISTNSSVTNPPDNWARFKSLLSPYMNVPEAVFIPQNYSWYYHYYYAGGSEVVFGAGPPVNKCIKLNNGAYLKTYLFNYPTPASLNDGGIYPNQYEILLGDYEIRDGWESCSS